MMLIAVCVSHLFRFVTGGTASRVTTGMLLFSEFLEILCFRVDSKYHSSSSGVLFEHFV